MLGGLGMAAESTTWDTREIAVHCAAAPAALVRVHEAIALLWERMCPAPAHDWRLRFELAVAEVAANIIEHARPAEISLRLHVAPEWVSAEFGDDGLRCEYPPPAAGAAACEGELAERGRGLCLVRIAVDEIRYERAGDLNRWRLVKWL
jgi:serine/threonine-protein kinase RsbW